MNKFGTRDIPKLIRELRFQESRHRVFDEERLADLLRDASDSLENEQAWKEQAARIIDPASWAVMDSYLKQMLRKYKGQNIGYDPEAFKHKESMAIAAALWPLVQQTIAVERDKALQEAAGIAETYSWQDGKMTENSCCAATGCDIAAAIRQMKGEG